MADVQDTSLTLWSSPVAMGGRLRRGNYNRADGWPHVVAAIGQHGLHSHDDVPAQGPVAYKAIAGGIDRATTCVRNWSPNSRHDQEDQVRGLRS